VKFLLTLLDMALERQIELAISDAIPSETLRILRDKFHRTPEQLEDADRSSPYKIQATVDHKTLGGQSSACRVRATASTRAGSKRAAENVNLQTTGCEGLQAAGIAGACNQLNLEFSWTAA
jgi:hypothetical protein